MIFQFALGPRSDQARDDGNATKLAFETGPGPNVSKHLLDRQTPHLGAESLRCGGFLHAERPFSKRSLISPPRPGIINTRISDWISEHQIFQARGVT